jgi:SAM-dependent MidA family methyltransferase
MDAKAGAVRWRAAMEIALYGPGGFFVRPASGPGDHFRTSAHASGAFVAAVLRLLDGVDVALGRPATVDLVDVGAGRGELLAGVLAAAPAALRSRLRPVAVERAPRPAGLPPEIAWEAALPASVAGLLTATEWLDNVPLDVAESGRYLVVDAATGAEAVDIPVDDADAAWLRRWWPTGPRREIGRPRDEAWAAAVGSLTRGLALCVDYGHLRSTRPVGGTLTGFRSGRQVAPVPDGSCDVTAHVAVDAVAAAGSAAAGGLPYALLTQREALRALGASAARPPLSLASTDPAAYVRALAAASAVGELTDAAGLGGHWWLLQPVEIDPQSVTRWTGSPVTRDIAS